MSRRAGRLKRPFPRLSIFVLPRWLRPIRCPLRIRASPRQAARMENDARTELAVQQREEVLESGIKHGIELRPEQHGLVPQCREKRQR